MIISFLVTLKLRFLDRDREDRRDRSRDRSRDYDRDRNRDRGGDRGNDRGGDRDGRFPRKSGPQPQDVCYNCGGTGHW